MNNVVRIDKPTYYAFDTVACGSYTLGIEKLSDMVYELHRIAEAHWAETEILYRQDKSTPNYQAFIALENEGKFVVFTARHKKSGELIGHLAFYVYESMHSMGVMEAREDAFFIQKDHRGGRLAIRLYDYAEECFRKMKVHQMSMSSKEPAGGPSLDKFLRRKGYKPVAIGYFKELSEENSDGNV